MLRQARNLPAQTAPALQQPLVCAARLGSSSASAAHRLRSTLSPTPALQQLLAAVQRLAAHADSLQHARPASNLHSVQ